MDLDRKCIKGFMTVEEAAERLGWTRQGVRKLIRSGRMPAERIGRMFLIPRKSFARVKRIIRG